MTNYGDHNHDMRVRGLLIIAAILLVFSLATTCMGCQYDPQNIDGKVKSFGHIKGEIAAHFHERGHRCEVIFNEGWFIGHVDEIPFAVHYSAWRSYPQMTVDPITDILDDWLAFEFAAREAGQQ